MNGGETDYYPFGGVLSNWESNSNDKYRFGYQGEYAEKDEETGFNHFEAREYDSRIGRWLSADPARQFASPYNGMGNNPVSRIDPDGAFSPPDVFKENASGGWDLVESNNFIVDEFLFLNGDIGFFNKQDFTMSIINSSDFVIPKLNNAFSFSVTLSGAWDTNGIGYSIGAFKALDGFHFYSSQLKPFDSNTVTNLSLGLSLDYTFYKSFDNTPVTMNDFLGNGYEFSGSFLDIGGSYSIPTESFRPSFSNYKKSYEGFQFNLGIGLPAGYTSWKTRTIPLRDPISKTY